MLYDTVYPGVSDYEAWQAQAKDTTFIICDLSEYPKHPVKLTPCPHCEVESVSKVEYKITLCTHIYAVAFFILCFACILIPYFLKSFRDGIHTCENCNAYLGTHRPIGSKIYH